MKTELMNIAGKGVCIVISELNVNEIISALGGNVTAFSNALFSNIHIIADEIRAGRKIAAIKETRSQTGWGLREAKEYIDKFIPPSGYGYGGPPERDYGVCADNFLKTHMPKDFIGDNDFKL